MGREQPLGHHREDQRPARRQQPRRQVKGQALRAVMLGRRAQSGDPDIVGVDVDHRQFARMPVMRHHIDLAAEAVGIGALDPPGEPRLVRVAPEAAIVGPVPPLQQRGTGLHRAVEAQRRAERGQRGDIDRAQRRVGPEPAPQPRRPPRRLERRQHGAGEQAARPPAVARIGRQGTRPRLLQPPRAPPEIHEQNEGARRARVLRGAAVAQPELAPVDRARRAAHIAGEFGRHLEAEMALEQREGLGHRRRQAAGPRFLRQHVPPHVAARALDETQRIGHPAQRDHRVPHRGVRDGVQDVVCRAEHRHALAGQARRPAAGPESGIRCGAAIMVHDVPVQVDLAARAIGETDAGRDPRIAIDQIGGVHLRRIGDETEIAQMPDRFRAALERHENVDVVHRPQAGILGKQRDRGAALDQRHRHAGLAEAAEHAARQPAADLVLRPAIAAQAAEPVLVGIVDVQADEIAVQQRQQALVAVIEVIDVDLPSQRGVGGARRLAIEQGRAQEIEIERRQR